MPVATEVPIEKAVLNALRRAGEPLTPKKMASYGEAKHNSIKSAVLRMEKAGDLERVGTGLYELPSRLSQTTESDDSQTELVQRTVSPAEKEQLEDVMRRQTKLTVYPDVRPQCGDGNIIFDQATKVEIQMPALLLEKLLGFRPPPVLGMMMCQGDSMSPVFEEDDPLLYRPSPDVASDGNYSFYLDDRLRAKRVEVIPGGGYKLISANTRAGYGHYRLVPGGDNGGLVNAETENEVGFQPIGKILWPRRDTGRLNVDQVADLLRSVVQQNS